MRATLFTLVLLASCASAPALPSSMPSVPSTPVPSSVSAATPEMFELRATAKNALLRYYAAVNTKDYQSAYAMWNGRSGQTYEQFSQGYADTVSVNVQFLAPSASDVSGAAGTTYVDLPVLVDAVERTGAVRSYLGRYVLRKSNLTAAEGATEAQRAWSIHEGELGEVAE